MDNEITITLQTPKGTKWDLKINKSKLAIVEENARKMGTKIIKVGA